MKKVPAKYSRCGIKVKCLKCTWLVNKVCRATNKSLSTCEHKDRHRYMFIVHVPGTKSGKIPKLAKAETFEDALLELVEFKRELKAQGFQKAEVKVVKLDTSVAGMMKEYLNYISGNGTHAHLKKKLSDEGVGEYKRVFLRFCEAIKRKGYNPQILDLKDVNDDVVEIFHFYVQDELKLVKTTYSKHFALMKAFLNWVIEKKDYKINNAFSHIRLEFNKRKKNPITQKEFEKLIEVITPENGVVIEKSGKKRNRYKPWLKTALKIALETGLRREELISLKWCDIRTIEYQGVKCYIIDVNNLKVNRQQFGEDSGGYVKPIPVTRGLLELFNSLGLKEKMGSDEYIIDRGERTDIKNLLDDMSRGFAHYIRFVTDRKIEFKDLRKTYITQLSLKLGKNTKLFTGHSDDQVLRDSYIAEEFISANLGSFSVFGDEKVLSDKQNAA